MRTASDVKRCKTCGCIITAGEHPMDAGYAMSESGDITCYKCCAESEKQYMIKNGEIDLYLVFSNFGEYGAEIVNWSGTLRFTAKRFKYGEHNIAKIRTDVWFDFEGYEWHGTQYGEISEICHCRKTKRGSVCVGESVN